MKGLSKQSNTHLSLEDGLLIRIYSTSRKIVPEKYHHSVQRCSRYVSSLLYYGQRVTCPICGGHFRKLLPSSKSRPNSLCPGCGSRERHRLLWLYLKDKTDFFAKSLRVLEIAPIEGMQRKFRALRNLDYISVDLKSPTAMLKMDITDLLFPNDHFDCVICSHVLEHVPDDKRAIGEVFRVLKPGGWAIMQVPIIRQQTLEDPDITMPEERERIYGQYDHVRAYGLDYKDRLSAAGFTVTVDGYVKQMDVQVISKYGLMESEDIYFCIKPV